MAAHPLFLATAIEAVQRAAFAADVSTVPIDKALAHLTIERLQSAPKWTELDAMRSAAEKLILDFKNALPALRRNWFAGLDAGIVVISLSQADNSTVSFVRY